MKCPECGEELQLANRNRVLVNMETYGKSCNAKTECCGKVVRLMPVSGFRAYRTDQPKDGKDDWGC